MAHPPGLLGQTTASESIFRVASNHISHEEGSTIRGFQFRCRSSQGAVLAVTSPTDLEEVADSSAIREHIAQHAELLYKHASTIRRIADNEALYIITGCIKSESWALAAFNDPTTSSADVLELLKRSHVGHPSPEFIWTERATSEARVGRGKTLGTKDQSLFLRGFKLDFSQEFRSRMKSVKLDMRPHVGLAEFNRGHSETTGSAGSTTATSEFPGWGNDTPGSVDANGSSLDNYPADGHLSPGSSAEEIHITSLVQEFNRSVSYIYSSFGSKSVTDGPQVYHPCDLINKCILENVGYVLVPVSGECVILKTIRRTQISL